MSPPTRALILTSLVLQTADLHAITLMVDRTDDIIMTGCNDAVLIDCSLRGAVIVANLTPGHDTIVIPEGT